MSDLLWLDHDFCDRIFLYQKCLLHEVLVVSIIAQLHQITDLTRDGEGNTEIREIESGRLESSVDF